MESQIFTTVTTLIEKIHCCNSCLGRQFGNLLTGLSNAERGSAIKTFMTMEWEVNHRLTKSDSIQYTSLLSKDFPIGVYSANRYFSDILPESISCGICQDFLLKSCSGEFGFLI